MNKRIIMLLLLTVLAAAMTAGCSGNTTDPVSNETAAASYDILQGNVGADNGEKDGNGSGTGAGNSDDGSYGTEQTPAESKQPVENKISDQIPGIEHQGNLVRAGAVSEMIEDIEKTGFTIEDIQTVYSESEMSAFLGIWGYSISPYVSCPPRSLRGVNSLFPVEYINRIDEETVYTVYKITDDNGEPMFMYLFYRKIDVPEKFDDGAVEKWWIEDPVFYMKKPLEYKDFSGIKIGSAASEVAAVDPIFNGRGTCSCHLLRDGILKIEYKSDEEDGINRVTAIEFNRSFEVPIMVDGIDSVISVKIAPEDYPA